MPDITYIRAKREKTILYLCIDKKDSIDQIKQSLCKALNNGKTSDEVRLLVEGNTKGEYKLLESAKALENADIVYFVYYDRDQGQWEDVHYSIPELDADDEEEVLQSPPPVPKKDKGKGKAT
ncbi:hypothetical protein BDF20DRAFT_313830 [Mycotypha africana]|uniref:uncharacterized protein n=1 Tax=Mycotypha africana TaxID=64632 RepID=UPI0022FFF598|nr:uncharacterized protein BDF20DRAFT_313830 [Mycotypha africana]KAI8988237.1 hypothetical protein BDF20DRAFT_313830 [Mycotypha africana]